MVQVSEGFSGSSGVQWDFCRKMRSVDMPLCTASGIKNSLDFLFPNKLKGSYVFSIFLRVFFDEYVQHHKNSTFGWGFLSLQAVRNHAKQLGRWVSSEKLVGVVCVFFRFLPLHFRAKGAMKKPCCLGYIGDETLPSNMRLYRAQMLLLLFVPK